MMLNSKDNFILSDQVPLLCLFAFSLVVKERPTFAIKCFYIQSSIPFHPVTIQLDKPSKPALFPCTLRLSSSYFSLVQLGCERVFFEAVDYLLQKSKLYSTYSISTMEQGKVSMCSFYQLCNIIQLRFIFMLLLSNEFAVGLHHTINAEDKRAYYVHRYYPSNYQQRSHIAVTYHWYKELVQLLSMIHGCNLHFCLLHKCSFYFCFYSTTLTVPMLLHSRNVVKNF
jgi:hypothetical protein